MGLGYVGAKLLLRQGWGVRARARARARARPRARARVRAIGVEPS